MDPQHITTAVEFAERRLDLPDGGRWHELDAGRVVVLQPPEQGHGTAVLNLSRSISEWLRAAKPSDRGYACFELGLVVLRNPDTVRSPAISYFTGGRRFEESDKLVSDRRPQLIVEVVSTNDRRRGIRSRVRDWHNWGVDTVWVADPLEKKVGVLPRGRAVRTLRSHQLLETQQLPGFSLSIRHLFAEPEWWTG